LTNEDAHKKSHPFLSRTPQKNSVLLSRDGNREEFNIYVYLANASMHFIRSCIAWKSNP